MSEECLELKNIKYQTMLLNNNSNIVSLQQNSINLEEFLEKEKKSNKKKNLGASLENPLNSLKLTQFVNYFSTENSLNVVEKKSTIKNI